MLSSDESNGSSRYLKREATVVMAGVIRSDGSDIDREIFRRAGLAGQDVPLRFVLGAESVSYRHHHLAAEQLASAGTANPRTALVLDGNANRFGGVKNRLTGVQRRRATGTDKLNRNRRIPIGWRFGPWWRGCGGRERLQRDSIRRYPQHEQFAAGGRRHRIRAAYERRTRCHIGHKHPQ